MKKYYMLTTSGRTAEVYIFGDITSWLQFENDVSSYTLSKELQGLDVDEIVVHLNSYGGEVAEGLAIYNVLRNHKAKVRTVVDGFACSIASVVFMAGEERVMNSASLLMVHNAWTFAYGNAAELRKQADDLDMITKAVMAAYLDRANIDEDKLKQLLDDESWITPNDALEMGFATSIIAAETPEAGRAAASARKALYQRVLNAKREVTSPPAPPAEPKEPTAPRTPPENKFIKFFSALAQKGVNL